jgi:hypothetical protein
MTKLKTAAKTCLMVSGMTGLILAQDNLPSSAFPTPSGESAPASAGAVAAPRTGLYTAVTKGNAAADNTVDDYSRRPTLIGDRQYFAGFGNDSLQNGAFSFEGKGLNWFGSVTGDGAPNLLRLGVGSGTAWGGGVLLGIDRTTVTDAAGNEVSTTLSGSGLGVFGDLNLGGSDVYGQVGWFTGFPGVFPATPAGFTADAWQTLSPDAGDESSLHNWNLGVLAGWKKDATNEGTHALNVELSYLFGSSVTDGVTPGFDNTTNQIFLTFMHGYILKSASDYAVFLGDNSGLFWQADHRDNPTSVDASNFGVFISPNIAFQKQFRHGFEGFSGAAFTVAINSSEDQPPATNTEVTSYTTGGADVALGLRWVYDNFAVEGSLKEAFLLNGPYLIGGNTNQGLNAQIGISLGI